MAQPATAPRDTPPAPLKCAFSSCNRLAYVDNRPGYTATYCGTDHQQYHLALLRSHRTPPDPTRPATTTSQPSSAPAALVCAIPSCHNPAFIDTHPGHVALCCSKCHQILYAALSNTPRCDLTDCLLPVLIDSEGTIHEYCCWDHAVIARDRGEVQISQDRPIAPAGTKACVHPGCDRTPVDFSIFCGRTHAYAHTRASRGLLPPSPPPSPPQSPRPSTEYRVDARSAHSQPAPAPVRFFSGIWHMSHAAWNKLQHALHGNAPPLPTQPTGDPLHALRPPRGPRQP